MCEKCLDYHNDHKVLTVALEARNYKKQYKEFQKQFKSNKPTWDTQYQGISDAKKAFDKAKELEIQEINAVFNKIFKKLEQKKQELIQSLNDKRSQVTN